MNTASQYMDKQIMDLSSSESPTTNGNNNSSSNNDFIDFMNGPPEKGGFVPSYDFKPVRPSAGFSSPQADRSSKIDSGDDDASLRAWNSMDSKINASTSRNYSSVDGDEPAKFISGKNEIASNATLDNSLVSEIDKTLKKYMDNIVPALDNMNVRLSQLETRTRNIENSIDDLKVSVGNSHGNTDGKMRHLEDILREVQSGVLVVKDKQEILEARLEISMLQAAPKAKQEIESKNFAENHKTEVNAHQQFPAISPPQPHPTPSSPNAPQPPTLQNLQPPPQLPNQFPQQPESYIPLPSQTPINPSHQYQIHPPQHQPAPPPVQHQYQSSPPQFSQLPSSSHPHPSFSPLNPNFPQPQLSHPREETSSILPPTYSSGIHLQSPSSQQYYGPNPNAYEPPPRRPDPGYPGHVEPYPYKNAPSQHGMKPQQHSSPGHETDYPQLPTARILPQALPTASPISGSSGSGSSGNRVPIDDIVNQVTNMGFPRDQVRATVRKLTESGQAVDLNVVLDKLMNGGF